MSRICGGGQADKPCTKSFCAAVEDGATASSRSSTSKNEASRANRPGTRLPEDPSFPRTPPGFRPQAKAREAERSAQRQINLQAPPGCGGGVEGVAPHVFAGILFA